MGLLTLPVKEARANVVPPLSLRDPALADMWYGANSASGQNVTSDSAMRVSTVYACVTILADTLAMLEKYIKRVQPNGGKIIDYGHRLYKQIHNRPNRWQSSFEYFKMMEGHVQMRGNAYARIVSTPGRGINELVPLHPDRTWPFVITPNGAIYFMYDNSPMPPMGSKLFYQHFPINGPTEILTQEEVHHVMGFSINGIVGMNPITKAAREAVGLAMATEEQGARLFSNGARIMTAVKFPGRVDDVTYKRMKEEVTDKILGSANAWRPFFMEEGMDIVNLGMTMEQSQFLETRNYQVEDVARFWKVPLVLLGHGDKAPTYSSNEQFLISFKVFTMGPNVKNWEDAMERDLLYPSEMNQVKIDFDMDSIMRGDAVARSTYLRNRFQMASISPDEVRLYEEENPSDQPGADKLYIMSNMVRLEDAGKVPAKQTPSNQGATP